MEHEEITDENYVKGFNEGYQLAQSHPEISEAIALAKGNDTRLEGFRDGYKEYVLEQLREKDPLMNFRNRTIPDKGKDNQPTKGFDIDK